MSASAHASDAAVDAIRERCRALGLPTWCWDAEGRVRGEPEGWGAAEGWLRAPAIREALVEARRGWMLDPSASVAEIAPGFWVIPSILTGVDGEVSGVVAAAAFGPELFEQDIFNAACASNDLLRYEVRRAVEPLARFRRDDVDERARVLGWISEDQERITRHAEEIDGFSKQLVDVYEQMNLLYRIGEFMHGLEDPRGFVQVACELLHGTLAFRWIAVRFTSLPSLGPGLANELMVIGELPCSHTRYDRLAGELAMQSRPDDRPRVLDAAKTKLVALLESEVFVNPLLCNNQPAGVLLAGNKTGDDPGIDTVDMQLLSATADYMGAYLHNAAMFSEQRTTFLGTIKALSASIDAKDRYTQGHSERVAQLAWQLAIAVGMSDEEADRVRLAGTLHDIGKIGVPEAVLLKPGRLSNKEFEKIKEHPTIGYNILKDIEPLEDVLPGVLHHHERWDGRGYPAGLKGEAIPMLGRLLAVADAFDAMSSDRAYRPRMDREKVLREMKAGAGQQWDADLIKLFLALDLSRYDAMIERHATQDPVSKSISAPRAA